MTHKTRIVIAGVMVVALFTGCTVRKPSQVIFLDTSGALLLGHILGDGQRVLIQGLHGASYYGESNSTHFYSVIVDPIIVTNYVVELTDDRTNLVNDIATTGEFCRARGHIWQQHPNFNAYYNPSQGMTRKCAVCGLQQSQTISDWK